MMTSSVRDGNASDRIADGLRDAILRGELPPGSRIRQEEVAAQYGASRIPVRGALRILELQGLVELVANSGAWVARFSLAECEEMYQMRERIEPLLLRHSMPGLSPEVIEKIWSLTGTMEAARDADAFLQLDREFHFLTYSGASTIVLGSTVERLWNSTQLYRRAFTFLLDEPSMAIAHDEHRMLARALEAGDGDQAELVLTCHIRRTRQQLALHPDVFEAPVSGWNAASAPAAGTAWPVRQTGLLGVFGSFDHLSVDGLSLSVIRAHGGLDVAELPVVIDVVIGNDNLAWTWCRRSCSLTRCGCSR
jgi:DNA-binding GntR family transcriptional regulator